MNVSQNRKVIFFLLLSIVVIIFLAINQIFISQYVYKMVVSNHIDMTEQVFGVTTEGIYQYVNSMQNDLESITNYSSIVNFSQGGRQIIKEFQIFYDDYFTNVTRLDSNGIIQYTYPENPSAVGENVLYQDHNQRLFEEQRTIVSTPFMAVQGYEAIAIAVPVFAEGRFAGSITGLIPFMKIWDLFVSDIHLSENSFVVVCNSRNQVIYAPEFMKEVHSLEGMIAYFSINGSEFDKDAVNRNFITLKPGENSKEEKYLFVMDKLDIENNEWCILGFTPESDLKKLNYRLSLNQLIFTYLVIFLLIIISAIFILHQNVLLVRKTAQFSSAFAEKERFKGQKHFFENVVKRIMQLRGLTLLLTDRNGNIVYRSADLRWLKGNLFSRIEEHSLARLKSNIEYVSKGNVSSTIIIPIYDGRTTKKYMLNNTILNYENEDYLFFAGFEYDSISSNLSGTDVQAVSEWIHDSKTMCITDNKGSIIAYNNAFLERFGRKDNITGICVGECARSILDAISKTVTNLSEIAVSIDTEADKFDITLNPVLNELAKPKTVSVEIK